VLDAARGCSNAESHDAAACPTPSACGAAGRRVTAVSGLIRYPEERAVEDAAYRMGLIPTRLCRVMLPVWRAEVRATIYDSEPYDLIDRYLEAAIAKGGLGKPGRARGVLRPGPGCDGQRGAVP